MSQKDPLEPSDSHSPDPIDQVPVPRLNPWLAIALLELMVVIHLFLWKKLLGG